MIIPSQGRGTRFTRDLRREILTQVRGGKSEPNALEKSVCLKWNITGRSMRDHFKDCVEFGLVVMDKTGKLKLTESGETWLYMMDTEAESDTIPTDGKGGD